MADEDIKQVIIQNFSYMIAYAYAGWILDDLQNAGLLKVEE